MADRPHAKDYRWIPQFEKKKKGRPVPNGRELPEDTYDQSPGEVARRLRQHSKDYGDAMKRLTFYKNRQGRNLSTTEKQHLEHAKEAVKNNYGKQEKPKAPKQPKQPKAPKPPSPPSSPSTNASVVLNASARIKAVKSDE